MVKLLSIDQLKEIYTEISEAPYLISSLKFEELLQVYFYSVELKDEVSQEIIKLIVSSGEYKETESMSFNEKFEYWAERYNAGQFKELVSIHSKIFKQLIGKKKFQKKYSSDTGAMLSSFIKVLEDPILAFDLSLTDKRKLMAYAVKMNEEYTAGIEALINEKPDFEYPSEYLPDKKSDFWKHRFIDQGDIRPLAVEVYKAVNNALLSDKKLKKTLSSKVIELKKIDRLEASSEKINYRLPIYFCIGLLLESKKIPINQITKTYLKNYISSNFKSTKTQQPLASAQRIVNALCGYDTKKPLELAILEYNSKEKTWSFNKTKFATMKTRYSSEYLIGKGLLETME